MKVQVKKKPRREMKKDIKIMVNALKKLFFFGYQHLNVCVCWGKWGGG